MSQIIFVWKLRKSCSCSRKTQRHNKITQGHPYSLRIGFIISLICWGNKSRKTLNSPVQKMNVDLSRHFLFLWHCVLLVATVSEISVRFKSQLTTQISRINSHGSMDRNYNFGKRKLFNRFICSQFILFRSFSRFVYALSMQRGVSDCLSNKSVLADWLTYKNVCWGATVRRVALLFAMR